MRISEANTTNKKVLTFNDIRGVDLTSAPLRVKPTRASYMKNMICKGGVNHKRNGFSQIAEFKGANDEALPINGIFPYKTEEYAFIVHAGTNLFACDEEFNQKTQITLSSGVSLANEKSQGYINGGALYLISGGKLLVYAGDKVKPFYESEGLYIPTTSIGITDAKNHSLTEKYEDVNLFGKKRKNKLTGARDGTWKNISVDGESVEIFTLEGSKGVFYLDGEIDLSKKVVISASTYITNKNNPDKENVMYLNAHFEESGNRTEMMVNTVFEFNGASSVEGESSFIRNGKNVKITKFKETAVAGTSLSGFEGLFKATLENRDGRGVVIFEPALPTYNEGEDNITVEYSAVREEPKIKASAFCDIGGKNKVLVLADENDVVYFSSASEGLSYVPDMQYLKVIENINAIAPGPDFVAIFSEREMAIVSLAISNESKGIVVAPTLLQHHRDIGCTAPSSLSVLNGDLLALAQGGVYGIEKAGVHHRSTNINKELLSTDKALYEAATGLVHDGKYYLFVGDVVYVADARYKTYESARLDVSYEYEWWRWEDLSCRSALIHNEKIVLGLEDGALMVMNDEYLDRKYHVVSYTEGITDGEKFDFSEELNIKDGDKIKIENAKRSVMHLDEVYLYKNADSLMIRLNEADFQKLVYSGLYVPGISILIKNSNVGEFLYTVTDFNLDTLSVMGNYEMVAGEMTNQDLTIYRDVEENDVLVPTLSEDGYIMIDGDGEVVSFTDYEDMVITRLREKPVECELHTAVLTLGSEIQKKKIHKIVFVPGVDTCGTIQIECETDRSLSKKSQDISKELDFGALDFGSFAFDASFYRRFEKKMNERNVDFVKFKLLSSADADFSIEDFKCIYSINTR